jgi:hypothetical protein
LASRIALGISRLYLRTGLHVIGLHEPLLQLPRLRRPSPRNAKGNLVAGNGLTIAYASYNKTATIARGTSSIAFQHDPEHQRYSQTGGSGVTLYFPAMGVLAERFGQLTGPQRWTNYLVVGGRLIGIRAENADETTLTRYPGLRRGRPPHRPPGLHRRHQHTFRPPGFHTLVEGRQLIGRCLGRCRIVRQRNVGEGWPNCGSAD